MESPENSATNGLKPETQVVKRIEKDILDSFDGLSPAEPDSKPQNYPEMQEVEPVEEEILDPFDGLSPAEPDSKPKSLYDLLKGPTAAPVTCAEEKITFMEATKIGRIPGGAPFVTGYITMTFDNCAAVAVDYNNKTTYIKILDSTTIVGTKIAVIPKTIPLGAEVQIFRVKDASDSFPKRKKKLLEECKMIGLVMYVGSRKNAQLTGKPVFGVTVGRFDTEDICIQIITENHTNGFPIFHRFFPVEKKDYPLQEGQIFKFTQYELPQGFKFIETTNGMQAVKDGKEIDGPLALINPIKLTEQEKECIATRGLKKTGDFDPEVHIRSVLISDAIFRNIEDKKMVMKRTMKKVTPDIYEENGRFLCEMVVPGHWAREDEYWKNEGWTVGFSLVATFKGDRDGASVMVSVKTVDTDPFDQETYVTLEFAESGNQLLRTWSKKPFPINIGPSSSTINLEAYKAIMEGFTRFSQSTLFQELMTGANLAEEAEEFPVSHEGGVDLDSYQLKALASILKPKGISITVAPPGTGKTMLFAVAIRNLMNGSDEKRKVLISSSTNAAVSNALFSITSEAMDGLRVTRLASQNSDFFATDEERKFMSNHQVQDYKQWFPNGKIDEEFAEMIERQKEITEDLQKIEDPLLMTDCLEKMKTMDREAVEGFLNVYNPNVILSTLTTILRNQKLKLLEEVTHLVIDEASQVPPYQLMAVLCLLPNLVKVILIGDPHQIPPFTTYPDDCDMLELVGKSDIERLYESNLRNADVLLNVYRCHQLLTENILKPIYPAPIVSPLTLDDRNGARQLSMPIARDGTPCMMFNIKSGPEQKGVSEEEAQAIERFIGKSLLRNSELKLTDFVVLVYHRKQRGLLAAILPPEVMVRTIDGYQGHQAKFVIISTVKNSKFVNEKAAKIFIQKAMKFVANPKRTLVAVSRCTDGLYIFGNMNQLAMTNVYGILMSWARKAGAVEDIDGGHEPPCEKRKRRR